MYKFNATTHTHTHTHRADSEVDGSEVDGWVETSLPTKKTSFLCEFNFQQSFPAIALLDLHLLSDFVFTHVHVT